MALGTFGIGLIVWPDSGVLAEGEAIWFLIALIAPVGFALANNCAAWLRPPAAPSIAMASGTLLGGATVAIALTLVLQQDFWPRETGTAQVIPLLLASIINAAFYFLFFWLVDAIGPARFSIFNYLAVAAGILWSMAFFREIPTPMFWVAAALMLFGMHLALRPEPVKT
jgi:drug/metabolite transporter (DMT)-like permease